LSDLLVAALAGLALVAGAIAAVAGFGIGSLLTPALAVSVGVKVAVTLVALPHLAATVYRLWLLRRDIDRGVLLTFGLTSAAGGLAGAVLHGLISSPALSIVLGGLLVFAGVLELTGIGRQVVLGGPLAVGAGGLSGLFGGLVGNQGGIRSAALLRFNLSGPALVATSTATGMLVDLARIPVYVATGWSDLVAYWPLVALLAVGALAGTVIGAPVVCRLPQQRFRQLLAVLLIGLGLLLVTGLGS